jgi:hypothetical protein
MNSILHPRSIAKLEYKFDVMITIQSGRLERDVMSLSVNQAAKKCESHVPPFSGTWLSTASVAAIVCFNGWTISSVSLWPFLGFGIVLLLLSATFECMNMISERSELNASTYDRFL